MDPIYIKKQTNKTLDSDHPRTYEWGQKETKNCSVCTASLGKEKKR